MNQEKLTIKSQEVLQQSASIAAELQHQAIEPVHLLKSILETDEHVMGYLVKKLGITRGLLDNRIEESLKSLPRVSGQQPYLSNGAVQVFQQAEKEMAAMKDEFIAVEHLLLALTAVKDSVSALLKASGFERDKVVKAVKELRGGNKVSDQNAEAKYKSLERYSKNLNDLAKKGKIDPVIGRDEEIRRVLQILSRRTKNNPILLGEPGVGKTAIVEGMAQRIVNGDVPENLKSKVLVSLD
ncbi:MAG: Clp protease N-terminal domain-containing protein, partial [Bacteroidota bacterium]